MMLFLSLSLILLGFFFFFAVAWRVPISHHFALRDCILGRFWLAGLSTVVLSMYHLTRFINLYTCINSQQFISDTRLIVSISPSPSSSSTSPPPRQILTFIQRNYQNDFHTHLPQHPHQHLYFHPRGPNCRLRPSPFPGNPTSCHHRRTGDGRSRSCQRRTSRCTQEWVRVCSAGGDNAGEGAGDGREVGGMFLPFASPSYIRYVVVYADG